MTARGYHHGDLRAALITAAVAVIEERGVDAFSLRETARRAGVSATAPAHHFGDARGLLTEIATEAFIALGDALAAADAAAGPTRRARLMAQGQAYVRFALAHPGRYRLMWRKALLDKSAPGHVEAGDRAFTILDHAARGADAVGDSGPRDLALAPSIACWSLVHGFAALALDGAFAPQGQEAEGLEPLLERALGYLELD
ncbi:MAG: TetR/AcrR family transcriptional regulator [Pseudomonadota bacterium]|uniref:TetR/AcrR family transcriptional regulator n=1 Tax=Sphingomonas sp. ERG5 TaxID=1381597 RepID=UPI00068EBD19|nr:TetR/AcrR family transcriptional regulator [Sphingomonas sp. ERG5]